jgi:flagellar biosynthesis/type III secretory pathway protein FliH
MRGRDAWYGLPGGLQPHREYPEMCRETFEQAFDHGFARCPAPGKAKWATQAFERGTQRGWEDGYNAGAEDGFRRALALFQQGGKARVLNDARRRAR